MHGTSFLRPMKNATSQRRDVGHTKATTEILAFDFALARMTSRGGLCVLDAVDERLQLAAAAGVAQLAEGLGFDLADAFAGDLEGLADLFELVFGSVLAAETHLDDALFSRSEGPKYLRGGLLQVDRDDGG